MSDFLCLNCEKTFDEPIEFSEPDGYDIDPYRYSYYCPYCGSDNYGEIIGHCNICLKDISENEKHYKLHLKNTFFCENCIEERGN